jgi:N-acetylglucosaminyldiphosphoundecaprenol N-acetyl-beta-D-mannosaminyltransferase
MLQKIKILDVNITNETEEKVLEYLLERIKNGRQKTFIITPNPEILVYAKNHLDYKDKLNSSDIALPDGIGLFFASGVLGEPLQDRITGVDFLEKLCKTARENPLSMGFLGGKDGIAKRAAKCLLEMYPWLEIVFVAEEWSEEGFKGASSLQLVSQKQEKKQNTKYKKPNSIDILFVAYGFPKQEEWIYKNLPKIPVKAAVGVGGAFDYLSGSVIRAPFIVRLLGFEWLFRLIVQPWRWKRQLALIEFVKLVFREKFAAR